MPLGDPLCPRKIPHELDADPACRAANAANSVVHVKADGSWTATMCTSEDPVQGGIFDITVFPWNCRAEIMETAGRISASLGGK